MNVSTSKPFQLIYSLYQHEYLGYLFESFVVQLDDQGKLTLQHQNISSQNADEFANGLDETDYELIGLTDSMHQDAVIKHFNKVRIKPRLFFEKIYNKQKPDNTRQGLIQNYLEIRRAKVLEKLQGKLLFEMGSDGEPTWKQIEVMPRKSYCTFSLQKK
jgi:hypothetical protein